MCTTTTITTGFDAEVKQMVLVSPSDPTPTHVLPLSALDSQLFLRFTIEYLLVYRSEPAFANRSATVARFKSALGRALVPYYPLSGRVRRRPDGNHLEVVCRSQGALFIEAESTHEDPHWNWSAEFGAAPNCKNRWRSLLAVHVDDVLRGVPPLIVQLTWLGHGEAFAIGVGINHCLCDGIGSAEFLNFFAELVSNDDSAELKRKPVWDRHLLDPVRLDPVPVPHPEFGRVPDVSGFASRFTHETLSPTSVTFDKKALNELKKLGCSTLSRLGDRTGVQFTCFEVLSAHVWRSWARSLNLPAQQTLRILFSVDVRRRVKPSLPSGFYGNGFVLGCAQTTVKKLASRGLGYGAELVRRAKERVDDEYVRSVVESVSGEKSCPEASVGVLIVSQWSRLGLEKVDFGAGKPVQVGPVCCDRYCLFLPVFGDGDAVKVMVAVPNSAVGRYEYLVRSPYC